MGFTQAHGKARLYRTGLGGQGRGKARRRMTVTALIVAAGTGSALGGGMPKQFRPIGGKPVLRSCGRRIGVAIPRSTRCGW